MSLVYPFITRIISSYIHGNDRVLDIGCGPKLYAPHIDANYEGVDVYVADPKNPPEYLGSAAKIDCEENRFDLAFGIGTFCVIPEIDESFVEIQRVVKNKGRLLIFDYQLSVGEKLVASGHSNAWNFTQLERRLTNLGFKQIKDRSALAYNNKLFRLFYRLFPPLLSLFGAKPNWLIIEATIA